MPSIVFWVAVGLVVYHHAIYPALLRLLVRFRLAKGVRPAGAEEPGLVDPHPTIAIIVPVHNEAMVIASKVANLDALHYPRDKLDVVLALDGCTDATRPLAEAALRHVDRGPKWRIVEYARNVGKLAVLNDRIADIRSEIVALSDASAMIDAHALVRAAKHFRHDDVGVVCGTYHVTQPGSEGERAYWEHQTRVKADEAALAAPMGAHGAFYLVRRALWSPLPGDTINDDFVLPMRIVLAGHRAVYDPAIVATELERSVVRQEFRRRVRIGAGNLQQVVRLVGLGNPRRGWLAFVFLSGKGLRAHVPLLMACAFVASVVLAAKGSEFYSAVLLGELTVLAAAAAGLSTWGAALPRPFAWLGYLLLGHLAAGLGSLLFLTRHEGAVWRASTLGKAVVGAPHSAETP